MPMALIRKVDCVRLYVPDLEDGLAFYRDQLGHALIWRTETAAGLRLPESEAELVLQTEEQRQKLISWSTQQMKLPSLSNRLAVR